MALPLAPAPKSEEIVYAGWPLITVRVAWTLTALGVRVREDVLRDARENVLLQLEPECTPCMAEDRADALTRSFVARARGQRVEERWPLDAQMPLSGRWWHALQESLTPISAFVWRQCYANGRTFEHLQRALGVDRLALETARSGLREVLRHVATTDGVPLEDWSPERIDRLLVRYASYAPGPCPPAVEIVEGCHEDHVKRCVRCDRTARLVQSGILELEDLLSPTLGTYRSREATVLALHFHPGGRRHRATLMQELEASCFPLGDDLLLVDASRPEGVNPLLVLAAEVGEPPRHHIRGIRLSGAGQWSAHGLLGGLPDDAAHLVRGATWGEIEGIGELPAPLPEPPSARGAWGVTLALLFAAVGLARESWPADTDTVTYPLEAEFTSARGGIWAAFDVAEQAHLAVIQERAGVSEVVLSGGAAANKGDLAVGDGTYRLYAPAEGLLLVSADAPIVVPQGRSLDQLAAEIALGIDGVDIQLHRRGVPSQ